MNRLKEASALLDPYNPDRHGAWSRREATHLLRRTGFGATYGEITHVVEAGLEKTLDRLLTSQEETDEFRSADPVLRDTAFDTGSIDHLKAWWLYRMLYSANPLTEKMSLFWHNHFATSYAKVKSIDKMAAQNDLIRRHALGSFRELLHGMSRDPAMLVWLDGNDNRKRHANENFAREVMELFSLGVGNYTEQDINEAARAFTGWHLRNDQFWFNRVQHDFSSKTVLGKSGDLDGDDVVDVCLEQKACPRFLASKLLSMFVAPRPDETLVDAFADCIRGHGLRIDAALRDLFRSRLFFSSEVRHAIIKSPVDLVLGAAHSLGGRANLQAIRRLLANLGQDVFEPPTVKGWEGGRLWISSATLLQRANFATDLARNKHLGAITDPRETARASGIGSSPEIITHYVELLLARDIEPASMKRLQDYLREATGPAEQRVRGIIQLIMSMPEYQLM